MDDELVKLAERVAMLERVMVKTLLEIEPMLDKVQRQLVEIRRAAETTAKHTPRAAGVDKWFKTMAKIGKE